MSTDVDKFVLSEHIRVHTEYMLDFFRENGCAFLPQLVSRELAEEILRHIKAVVGFDYDELPQGSDGPNATFSTPSFAVNAMPRFQDPFLKQYVESPELGEVAATLTGI